MNASFSAHLQAGPSALIMLNREMPRRSGSPVEDSLRNSDQSQPLHLLEGA